MKRAAVLCLLCLACCGGEGLRRAAAPLALPHLLDVVLLVREGPPGWCAFRTYGGRSRALAGPGAARQRYADGCGAAALQLLLQECAGRRWNQNLLYALTRQPEGGTSLARLHSVARRLGALCDVDTLESAPAAWVVPALVHLRRRHFVVLVEMHEGRAEIIDPACGRLAVETGALRTAASGLALRCSVTRPAPRQGVGS